MLYNQPKQLFRKEVDIGTLRHVVQRLFMGLAPVVATASFPTYKSPKFHLSFTILVSFILVKYPDRDPDRRPSEYGTYCGTVCTYGMYLRYVPTNSYGMLDKAIE